MGAVIHDLKNLLNAINASAQACRLHVDEESTAEEFLERISNAAIRGGTLIEDVLNELDREPDSGSATVVELDESLDEICAFLEPTIPDGIRFELEPPEEPLSIQIDRGHLEDILANLVQNAVDAIEDSGRIVVSCSHTVLSPDDRRCTSGPLCSGRYVEIAVDDTGRGMPPDVRERVSEAFFSTREAPDSSGLGGWIAAKLVDRWNGAIAYDSEPGEGTTVSLLFPRVDADTLASPTDSGSIATVV